MLLCTVALCSQEETRILLDDDPAPGVAVAYCQNDRGRMYRSIVNLMGSPLYPGVRLLKAAIKRTTALQAQANFLHEVMKLPEYRAFSNAISSFEADPGADRLAVQRPDGRFLDQDDTKRLAAWLYHYIARSEPPRREAAIRGGGGGLPSSTSV